MYSSTNNVIRRTVLFRVVVICILLTPVKAVSSQHIRSTSNNNRNHNNHHKIINQWNRRNTNYYYNDGIRGTTYVDQYYSTYDLVQTLVNDTLVYSILDDQSRKYPMIMSIFCQSSLPFFSPFWVIPAPENYSSLCGTIPNETLVRFRTSFQYNNNFNYCLERPIAIILSNGNKTKDYAVNKTLCSVDDIMKNVELINEIPIGCNNITYIIVSESYKPPMKDSGNNSQNENAWNHMDPCMYTNIISLYVPDKITSKLESDVTKWQHQYQPEQQCQQNCSSDDTNNYDSSSLEHQFLLMIVYDVNYDGIISWDDYDAYHSHPEPEPIGSDNYGPSSSTEGISTHAKTWIISLAMVGIILCCLFYSKIRR